MQKKWTQSPQSLNINSSPKSESIKQWPWIAQTQTWTTCSFHTSFQAMMKTCNKQERTPAFVSIPSSKISWVHTKQRKTSSSLSEHISLTRKQLSLTSMNKHATSMNRLGYSWFFTSLLSMCLKIKCRT